MTATTTRTAPAPLPAPAAPAPRTLHMVDLENLIGDPVADADVALEALTDYLFTVGWAEGDQILLSVNAILMRKVMVGLPPLPMNLSIARRGRDGAERALVSKVTPDFVARRYERLSIGSGDGFFTEFASEVRAAGCEVVVVSRQGSINWRLYTAASRHLVLTEAGPEAGPEPEVQEAERIVPTAAGTVRAPSNPEGETAAGLQFIGLVARALGRHVVRRLRMRLDLRAGGAGKRH